MLRKPFKPPGSKDLGSSTPSTTALQVKSVQAKLALTPKSSVVKVEIAKLEEVKKPVILEELSANSELATPASTATEIKTTISAGSKLASKPFKLGASTITAPQKQPLGLTNKQSVETKVDTKEADDSKSKDEYFKCFWSKDVKKKHKVLDDGIIIFQGNKVQLYNSDGMKVYDSYKSKLYCPNPDNQDQYIVGSFFVEQDSVIKKEDFLSGRCFVKAKMTLDKDSLAQKKKAAAPFKLNKNSPNEEPKPQEIQIPTNSYVITDSGNPDIVPVFIDPYLADKMRIHQKQGVKFMFECISGLRGPDISGCILADSMGLGKTLQTIALIWTLIRRNPFSAKTPLIRKAVVVAPVSLLGTWKKEICKWLDDSRLIPKIAIGTRERVITACKDFAMGQQKVLLISYEQFRMHVDLLQDCCDLLIFDEGHRLKNMNIKTFRSFNQIKCSKRIILTGTPLQNSLDEFYSCVKFVNPNIFENEKQFKFVFSDPIFAALKTDASPDMIEKATVRSKELTHIISRFVLRRKADILEKLLPPRSEYFVFVKLTPLQTQLYKKMIASRYCKIDAETDAFSLLTVMRKLLNHPQLIYNNIENALSKEYKEHFPEDFQQDNWNYSNKFRFISEILDKMKQIEQETKLAERIIIVSYWTQTLDILQTMITQKSFKYVRLDGSVNAQKRQALIDRFQEQNTDIRVFLLCGKAGGTGLNLSAANRMVLMEPDWNPSNDLQVMGRIWRDGQKKPVHIYRLVSCGTMEEKVLQRQFLKEDLSHNVVDEKMIMKQYNSDTFKQLFEFKGDHNCLSFKEDENQLSQLKNYTPDYYPEMESYITYLKRTIKGEKKDVEVEVVPENEFEEGNIFLKPEVQDEEEVQDPKEEEGNEEAEEQLLKELESDVVVTITEKNKETSQENNDIELKEEKIIDQIVEDKVEKKQKPKKKQANKEIESEEIKTENVMQVEETKNEDTTQEQVGNTEEISPAKKGRKRAATPENPSLKILKKLKK